MGAGRWKKKGSSGTSFEYVWKYFQYSLTIDISGEYTH